MNFIFISPNFPKIYSHFVKALKNKGVNVLGIGDERFENLNDELKQYNTLRYELALNVVRELKLKDYAQILADNLFDINDTCNSETAMILKEMGLSNLISSDILKQSSVEYFLSKGNI